MGIKQFSKEKTISKLIFSFVMLAVFASIFGPSIYTQFTEKISFVFAAEVGYGGSGGIDGIFQCSTSNATETNGPAFTNLISDQIILVGQSTSFNLGTVNLTNPAYVISDSFTATSMSNSNINSSGDFIWTPIESDVGIHNIEVKASDNCGFIISTTFKILVYKAPELDEKVEVEVEVEPTPENIIKTPTINNKFVPKLPNTGATPTINNAE